MFDSPLSASAYEVLGVAPDVDDEALRRAYRLRLRQTHPDTGGDAAEFIRVQRAWEFVGTPEARAAYDRGRGSDAAPAPDDWHVRSTPTDTRPRARSYGHPGGWLRQRYLELIREWAGRGQDLPDPYAPEVVRAAPVELRHMLADALAEEATARTIAGLGIGFTVWHDVAVGEHPEHKLDHVVLSPSGLYGVMSADFGGEARFRRGEIIGAAVGGDAPVASLLGRMRAVARAAHVRFSGAIVVLPDDDLMQPVTHLGTVKGLPVAVVRRSVLGHLLRAGIPGTRDIGGNELFDVRTRLQQTIRFV
ncbi:DnaJ domain-containing protein [Microbacterium sp. NPDC096154]|uniref:J domain-containing protein n=1 Tax=Microbacterium sp. NPDC096154 TaxID=3155549 RepID=UPI0033197CBB